MAYFWLMQNRSGRKSYQDEEGKVYHYRGTVGGADKLSEGDFVVFYDSHRYSQVIFGAGRVTKIEGYLRFEGPEALRPIDEIPRSGEDLLEYLSDYELDDVPPPDETVAEYFAHIGEYHEIDPPVDVHSLEDDLSFLRDTPGVKGIPEASIYELNLKDYFAILEAAGLDDVDWLAEDTE